ncbi:MAG: hypothetical protein HOW73_03030 [Polyangiaceae bacterium]|nr:hypothetical protein [Polyangiaceae bacterium]
MRRLSIAAPILVLGAVAGFVACQSAPASGIGLSMSVPQGVLDDASSLTLYVFPAEGRSCESDGSASELPDDALTFPLSKSGCEGGATWCGEITLDQDDAQQIFHVQAKDSSGLLAQGCTTAVVDRDPLEVNIKVVRFVEPSCCGDATLQAGELCDNGGDDSCGGTTEDAVCASDCTTRAVWVDDTGSGGPTNNGQGDLSIAFTPGEGQLDGGLRAAWNFADGGQDIGLRVLQSNLNPIDDPAREPLFVAHRVYFRCSGTDQVVLRSQKSPSVAPQGSGAVLAYLSEEEQALRFDARVLTMNSDGCTDQLESLIVSNATATVDDIDVATGPNDTALIVWQQSGRIFGRTYAGTTLGGETITISTDGTAPRVTGSSDGWVVVYQGPGGGDTDGILMNRIDSSLNVSDVVLVNGETAGVQDQADVAMVSDGSVGVVYRSGGDVFLQRLSASDEPNGEDRGGPIHVDADGEQGEPSIAASASNDFFIVAWESGSEVRARFAGKSTGFLFNNVTGQNDDFSATSSSSAPKKPAVASGEFVAIGWQDLASATPGIFVRRFPLPN